MTQNITRKLHECSLVQLQQIHLLINNCLNHKELPVYGDGMNIRDWLFVEDHAKAIDMVINSGKIGGRL